MRAWMPISCGLIILQCAAAVEAIHGQGVSQLTRKAVAFGACMAVFFELIDVHDSLPDFEQVQAMFQSGIGISLLSAFGVRNRHSGPHLAIVASSWIVSVACCIVWLLRIGESHWPLLGEIDMAWMSACFILWAAVALFNPRAYIQHPRP